MNIRNNRWLSVFTLFICRANKQTLKLLFLTTVTSIGLNIVPAFAATPGTWVGETEFGTFDLVVNAQGTGIEKIDYHFSAFTCGPVTINGGVRVTPGTAWPISNDEFSITNTLHLANEMTITISGTFESTTEAAGTWDAVVLGEQCATGTWETSGGGSATGGTWVGAAEFGTFDLEVNVQGIGIERVDFQFSAFTCGPVTISGGIGFIPSAAWPISNGEFNITVTWPTEMAMTISGTFESATKAAGTWDAVFRGEQCTGTWEATIDDPEAFTMNAGLNDAWYNPVTDGQGFFITVFPDIEYVSLSWFTYDNVRPDEGMTANIGEPGHRWLNALGAYSGDQAVMDISYATGGIFDDPTEVTEINDGTIILTFTDCRNGTIEYDIPSINKQGTVPIQRIVGDNTALCETLAEQSTTRQNIANQKTDKSNTSSFDIPVISTEEPQLAEMNAGLNDAWYYPVTDGQGFFITVFPDIEYVSLSWFTYDNVRPDEGMTANIGEPGHRWLNALGAYSGNQAVMDISYATGGIFDDPTEVTEITDGIIILTFTDCRNGTIEYDIPSINKQGTVPIVRVADDNVALCERLAAQAATHLSWHTTMGSVSEDFGHAVAVDGSGNVYVAGWSDATWGSPIYPHAGGRDAFLAKLDSSGARLWHTFMGSSGWDEARSMAVDGDGNVYVVGTSDASWGTPVHSHAGEKDGFAIKLNSDGERQWHTFMGSSDWDEVGRAIGVDTSGSVYVSGIGGSLWDTVPVDPPPGTSTATKLSADGVRQWYTFMGAAGTTFVRSIAVDGNSNVYAAGRSFASWGTPVNPYAGGHSDTTVWKLDSSGARLWHTYMGSAGEDFGLGIAVDGSGNAYVSGASPMTWGGPINPFTSSAGEAEGFAAKLNSNGNRQWHTFLGSEGVGLGWGMAIDKSRNIFVGDIPHSVQLSPNGILQRNFTMPSGGSGEGGCIAVDTSGNVYFGGGIDFDWGTPVNPHAGAMGSWDAYVVKFETSVR